MENIENHKNNRDKKELSSGATAVQANSNAQKDPIDWTTGSEPMTGAQKSYLKTLSESAGEEFNENLTKAEAALKIDDLQKKTKGSSQHVPVSTANANTIKDPSEWATGDQEMTGAQRSYLKTLSDEAGQEADETLSKGEASKKIDELQQKTGRGASQ